MAFLLYLQITRIKYLKLSIDQQQLMNLLTDDDQKRRRLSYYMYVVYLFQVDVQSHIVHLHDVNQIAIKLLNG